MSRPLLASPAGVAETAIQPRFAGVPAGKSAGNEYLVKSDNEDKR
jgi:hypothetical protein